MDILKSSTLTVLFCLATVGLANNSARAAVTLNTSGLILVGASDVDVGGLLYDVTFLDGTCIDLFNGCDAPSDFTFTDFASAKLASQALLDQVLTGIYDTNPGLVFGASGGFGGVGSVIWTPFLGDGVTVSSAQASNYFGFTLLTDIVEPLIRDFSASANLLAYDSTVYACWNKRGDGGCIVPPVLTETIPAVPLPPSAILFGTALLGLAGIGRRKRKHAPKDDEKIGGIGWD